MITIDPRAAEQFQPELLSNESIYWAGFPSPSSIFNSDDWAIIPFSLLWGGFAIFWEAGVLGLWDNTPTNNTHPIPVFMVLWGIPFVLIGQYMIWGRFILDAWLKRRTWYAVTNRRVLILQESWRRKKTFLFLDSLAEISIEGSSIGTLWLGPKPPLFGGRGRSSRSWSRYAISESTPVLSDIENVDAVHRLILDLREKSKPRSTDTSKPVFTYPSQES